MRILVINPNTSAAMTKSIAHVLMEVKRPDSQVDVVNPAAGPEAIESAYDEARAIPEMLKLVQKAPGQGYDGVVIACFSDPGLDAARELVDIPVVGIQEASMYLAASLGSYFGVLTTLERRVPVRRRYADSLGLGEKMVATPVLNIPVAETVGSLERMKSVAIAKGREAIAQGAEVLILGCAGLGDWSREIQRELGVPIIDPNAAGLKLAESLVDLGLCHSKVRTFQHPRFVLPLEG
ncbi:MAG TPA: aspartate/glutamate racemase family protein [Chloroflexota bacterium]